MKYRVEAHLNAPAGQVWERLSDLRSWPDWAPTVESLDSQTARPQFGTRVTIKQPGRQPARYVINIVEDGRRFQWGSNRGGVRQSADHSVEPVGDTACTVRLTFAMTGPLGSILGVLGAGKIRAMVDTEARALRAVVETGQPSSRNAGQSPES